MMRSISSASTSSFLNTLVCLSFIRSLCQEAGGQETYAAEKTTRLSTIVISEANSSVAVEAVGPETAELDVALTHVCVGDEEPGTEDSLGKHIEDSIGDDLAVHAESARAVGQTPNTGICQTSRGRNIEVLT